MLSSRLLRRRSRINLIRYYNIVPSRRTLTSATFSGCLNTSSRGRLSTSSRLSFPCRRRFAAQLGVGSRIAFLSRRGLACRLCVASQLVVSGRLAFRVLLSLGRFVAFPSLLGFCRLLSSDGRLALRRLLGFRRLLSFPSLLRFCGLVRLCGRLAFLGLPTLGSICHRLGVRGSVCFVSRRCFFSSRRYLSNLLCFCGCARLVSGRALGRVAVGSVALAVLRVSSYLAVGGLRLIRGLLLDCRLFGVLRLLVVGLLSLRDDLLLTGALVVTSGLVSDLCDSLRRVFALFCRSVSGGLVYGAVSLRDVG